MTTIAIEVNHQWCQRLPLRDNVLVCIGCGQTKPIHAPLDGIMPCAELRAWQTPGATANGDFLIVRGRMTMQVYKGVNGRTVAIDLTKVEAILEEDDGEVHLFTSGDWYKVRAPFAEVVDDWRAGR